MAQYESLNAKLRILEKSQRRLKVLLGLACSVTCGLMVIGMSDGKKQELRVERIEIVDRKGRVIAVLGKVEKECGLVVYGDSSMRRAAFFGAKEGDLINEKIGMMQLFGRGRSAKVVVDAGEMGPTVSLYAKGVSPSVTAGYTGNHLGLVVKDNKNRIRASIGVSAEGEIEMERSKR